MSLRSPMLLLAGIFGAVLLATLGLVLLRGNSLLAGLVAIFLAIVVFLISAKRLRAGAPPDASMLQDVRRRLPLALVGLAFFFCLLAVYEVGQPRTLAADRLSGAVWILSIACLVVGILAWEHWSLRLRAVVEWLRANQLEAFLAISIFAVALLARLVLLEQHPFPWSGDEASVGTEARRILMGQSPDPFNTGWSGQPNLSFVPTALSLAVFGNTLFALRAVSAFIGALSAVTLYLAGRALFGRTVAVIAAAFIVSFPIHLQFSRIGVSNIMDAFLVTLCLWLTVRAQHQETLRAFMWAGLATGLGLYTYVGSRLVIALGLATLIYFVIRNRGYLRSHGWHLAAYAAGVFIMAAPMAFFMLQHPDIFMTRLAQTSILHNGWLLNESAATGDSIAAILLNQFKLSTLVFISQPAIGMFFNSPQPYLTIFGALFFLIGMGYAFQNLLDFSFAVLLLWFWSVVILGGLLTLDPPANTRMVMTTPAVAIFVALGITEILKILADIKVPRQWLTIVGAGVVTLLVIQNALFYFGTYRTGNYSSDANAEVAEAVGFELKSLGPNYRLLMMGQPRLYAGFPTIVFLAPRNSISDLDPSQAASVDLSTLQHALVVAIPDNVAALKTIAARYPGGVWQAIPRQTKSEILYYAYVVGKPIPTEP